jgi:hypothetical protein
MGRLYGQGVKLPLKPGRKRRLGRGGGLVKTAPSKTDREQSMADDKVHPTATEMDYPAHFRNYDGFLKLLKYGAILSFITALVVMYIIYN